MNLQEIYGVDQHEFNQCKEDLSATARLIIDWLNGYNVDSMKAKKAAELFSKIANDTESLD